MKANTIRTLFTVILLLSLGLTAFSQGTNIMHFMKGMPQSSKYNPALHNDSSTVVIGLPGLSGIYLGLNSDFALNDLIHYGTGNMSDSLIIDIDGFHNGLKDQNYFRQDAEISLFSFGFRTHRAFINFSVTEKQSAQIGFSKSFVTFLKEGNAPYIGQNFDLGDMDFNLFHYREFALGFSHELMQGKLSIGAKAKALFGKAAMQTNKLNFKVNTAADGSSILLQTDMSVDFSAPVTPKYDESNFFDGFEDDFTADEYILTSKNMGVAFDLGAVYKVNPKIMVSASIIDLGSIPFKNNVYNIRHAQSYSWEGLDFSNSLDDTKPGYISADDMLDTEMDKLEAVVRPKKDEISSDKFTLSIPTKLFVGGTYTMNNKLNFSVLDRLYMHNGQTQNSLSLSANAMLGNSFRLQDHTLLLETDTTI